MPVSLRQRFERFFNASSDCQFYVKPDEQGRFKYVHVNPAALAVTGRARECDVLGLTPVEVLGDDYGRTVQTTIEKAYRQAAPYHFTGALGRSGGGPSYDAYYIPLVEDDGRVVGVLGTARDITQVTSLNEQLLHGQRLEALGELSGSVAHDFNNVLSILQGAVHFLKRDNLSETKRSVVLGEAERAIETGMALTKRLTAFARKERIQALPHDIVTLVLTCQPMMRRVLGKRIKLDFQLPPDLWRACCDKNEFEIAMINLAANARDAIDDEGEVLVTARNKTRSSTDLVSYPNEYVEITVTDSGSGMSAEVARKALEPFFTTKSLGQGTGLGVKRRSKGTPDRRRRGTPFSDNMMLVC